MHTVYSACDGQFECSIAINSTYFEGGGWEGLDLTTYSVQIYEFPSKGYLCQSDAIINKRQESTTVSQRDLKLSYHITYPRLA